jgi:1A family penicillin-binding protein
MVGMTSPKKPSKKFFDTLHEVKRYTHVHVQKKTVPHIEKQVKKTKSTWKKLMSWAGHHTQLIIYIGAITTAVVAGLFFIWVATLKIPTLDNFAERKVTSSTQIYDRNGVILYDVHENIKRTVVVGDAIDVDIKHAVIAIEDKDFYQHNGIKVTSIFRAILSNLIPLNGTQGGSTITQQVIKNTLLNSEKRISRKIKEWILALKLEQVMNKDEILGLYLNEVPYGGAVYGVEQAAQGFFGKSSNDVTIAESAYLAAIPNAPSYYSPYGKNKNLLDNRKNLVLKKMQEQGYITNDEYSKAKEEVVVFKSQSDNSGKALHFIDYIRSYLEEVYGKESLLVDGFKVTTTLDWKLQEEAEKIVKENALKNEKEWNASNMALIAIDPKTGQILSMVGSRDYSDTAIDGQFNVTTAPRQPGSSFKPIIYTRAFEKGYRPETVLFDVPTQFNPNCGAFSRESGATGCYAPDNYDGKFVGPISLRGALGQSRNVPAVQLLYLVGIADALQTAKQLGITTLDKNIDRYGLTLVLGGGEVSLLELTSVYGVFGNDGVRVPPTGILKIENLNGKVLEEYKQKGEQVISADATRMISSVLSDNVARTPLFGANSQLYYGDRPVAAKSGTTNDNKDAWLIGYTPDLAVGVWSGNNDNKVMKKGSSISIPAWRAYMNVALKNKPITSFNSYGSGASNTPPVIRGLWWGGESFFTDKISGKLATEYTPNETKEEHVITNPHNILYWINKDNLTASRPGIGISDGQYKNWEASFQSWIQTNGLGNIESAPEKPDQTDDIHKPEFNPTMTINQPSTNDIVTMNKEVAINASANGPRPIQKFEFYVNDQFIGSVDGEDVNYSFIPSDYISAPGIIQLRVVAVDIVYNKSEQSIQLNVQ